MKKLTYIGFAVLMIIVFAGPAFADVTWGNEGNDPVTLGSGSGPIYGVPAEYGLSKNVYLNYTTDTEHMNYELGSCHKSGNRGYGTSNVTTLIYYDDKDTGETQMTMPGGPGTDHTFPSSWTAM